MPEIRVAGINISIPVIGFGCSSLTSVGRKKALRLLESAFDVGIRHFDVARYYGYGEAEGILGTFIKSRRAQVTVIIQTYVRRQGRLYGPVLRAYRVLFGLHHDSALAAEPALL